MKNPINNRWQKEKERAEGGGQVIYVLSYSTCSYISEVV
jgi:hypothetical protein